MDRPICEQARTPGPEDGPDPGVRRPGQQPAPRPGGRPPGQHLVHGHPEGRHRPAGPANRPGSRVPAQRAGRARPAHADLRREERDPVLHAAVGSCRPPEHGERRDADREDAERQHVSLRHPSQLGRACPGMSTSAATVSARVDPATMKITEFPLPHADARPRRLTITPDDLIYYTDFPRGMLGRFDPKTRQVKEWLSPGGPDSEPYAITQIGGIVWYSESGVRPNTMVRFDPADREIPDVRDSVGRRRAPPLRSHEGRQHRHRQQRRQQDRAGRDRHAGGKPV